MTLHRPTPVHPAYPAILEVQLSHSARFARALRTLEEERAIADDLAATARDEESADESAEDAVSLWLEGRAEEVEVFTSDVLRAWSSGELGLSAAGRAIHDYVHALHVDLEAYGVAFALSCCGSFARAPASGVLRARSRRSDPLLATAADAPAVDPRPGDCGDRDRGAAPVALAYGHAMASRGPASRPARVG